MADLETITGDIAIWDDERSKSVDVVTDSGGVDRLAVQALIDGGTFSLQPYVPYTSFNSAGVSLNTSTWTTLLNLTSTAGKLDFVACAGSSSQYRIRITVDGHEVFDISMDDLGAIGLSNSINVQIWAETALKNFRYHPKTEVDFTDTLKIEAKAIVSAPTLAYYIGYREDGS